MINKDELIKKIEESIVAGKIKKSKLPLPATGIYGFCSHELRHFLNTVCAPAANYLELGSFRGASIVSAAYDNEGVFYAIDNFSDDPFGVERWNSAGWPNIRSTCLKNISQYLHDKVNFFDKNCLDVDVDGIKDVDVIFFDLFIPRKDVKEVLEKYKNTTKDVFILLISRYHNEHDVAGPLAKFIENNKYITHYKHYWKTYGSIGECSLGIFVLEKSK